MKKQDIDQEFPYADTLDSAGFKTKTMNNVKKLYESFGKEKTFGRGDVVEVLEVTSSPASTLLKRLRETGVIIPVTGAGKGKYRFRP